MRLGSFSVHLALRFALLVLVTARICTCDAFLEIKSGHRQPTSVSGPSQLNIIDAPLASKTTQLHMAAAGKMATKKASNTLFFKGRLTAFVSKFFITPATAWHIIQRLVGTLRKDWIDVVGIIVVYECALPIAQRVYQWEHQHLSPEVIEKRFLRSKTHRIGQAIREVAQLFGALLGAELGLVLLDELGFQFVSAYPVYNWVCSIVGGIWGATNLSEFKDFVLSKGGRIDLNQSAGRRLLSRFLDIAIYGSFSLLVLDFLSVQTGYALKSLFGLSSVGTLVFSLASKELVGEFLASLAIQGTNMYTEGERILLQDGTTGTVQKLGWLNTHLRRSDELVVRIPNTQISGKRVVNISRSRLSSVKQALSVSTDEIDKLPQFLEDVKAGIKQACPSVIDDGSRPLNIFYNEYKDKLLAVSVSAYFRTKPYSTEYQTVKQDALVAIRRAAAKNDIAISYVNWQKEGIPMD